MKQLSGRDFVTLTIGFSPYSASTTLLAAHYCHLLAYQTHFRLASLLATFFATLASGSARTSYLADSLSLTVSLAPLQIIKTTKP
ncbi:MAG: hypothetical protein IT168_27895 [Bryobacterales bacterium]|nr:hypothetical protein [Bryobacterales bacterium]